MPFFQCNLRENRFVAWRLEIGNKAQPINQCSPGEKRGKWEGRRHLERGGIARATGRVQLSGRGIVPLGLESNYSAGNGFCTADPLHFVSAHGY